MRDSDAGVYQTFAHLDVLTHSGVGFNEAPALSWEQHGLAHGVTWRRRARGGASQEIM